MKTLFKIQILCLAILFFTGCKKEDIDLYKGTNSIYFPDKESNELSSFSFGYVSSFITDTVLSINVSVTGAVTSFDRPYSMSIESSSTLNPANYKILNEKLQIAAGKLTDVISIRVKRTEDLKQDTLDLNLNLTPNEFFTNDLNYVKVGSGVNARQRPLYKLRLEVDDIIGVPYFWNPALNSTATTVIRYLGNFSAKKFQLMIGMFSLNVTEVTGSKYRPSPSLPIAWGTAMQAYLNQMKAVGTPIMDENDLPMVMGQLVQ